jgi:hypothetical protein
MELLCKLGSVIMHNIMSLWKVGRELIEMAWFTHVDKGPQTSENPEHPLYIYSVSSLTFFVF